MTGGHSQGEPGWVRLGDGRELFYQRRSGPDGVPTVVFEGGLAASRSYWATVQGELSAPSVVYDRSGLGRSAADGRPRRLTRLAQDLGELLDHLGQGPFVLVGHSWGGPVVRIAAAADPARVAGLVLVDPTDESCDLLFTPAIRRAEKIGQVGSAVLARAGLLHRTFRGLLASLPADAATDMRAEAFTVAAMRTRAAELASVAQDLRSLRENTPELGGVPVTVISAGRTSAGMNARVRALADASHEYRAGRSVRGRHVRATRSGHMVLETEPGLIADEIRRLLS